MHPDSEKLYKLNREILSATIRQMQEDIAVHKAKIALLEECIKLCKEKALGD